MRRCGTNREKSCGGNVAKELVESPVLELPGRGIFPSRHWRTRSPVCSAAAVRAPRAATGCGRGQDHANHPFLHDRLKFDSGAIAAMCIAYEKVRSILGIVDGDDRLNEIIAKKVIELAQAGETDPDQLPEKALIYFNAPVMPINSSRPPPQ